MAMSKFFKQYMKDNFLQENEEFSIRDATGVPQYPENKFYFNGQNGGKLTVKNGNRVANIDTLAVTLALFRGNLIPVKENFYPAIGQQYWYNMAFIQDNKVTRVEAVSLTNAANVRTQLSFSDMMLIGNNMAYATKEEAEFNAGKDKKWYQSVLDKCIAKNADNPNLYNLPHNIQNAEDKPEPNVNKVVEGYQALINAIKEMN